MNVIIFYVGNVYKDYLIFFIEMIMKVLCSIYVVVLFISCVMCQRLRGGLGLSLRGFLFFGMLGFYFVINNFYSVYSVLFNE